MQDLQVVQPTAARRSVAGRRSDGSADEVRALAAERNAVILAHNYQVPEVQDVADLWGTRCSLSREAAATAADVIAFCGVHFMAETASVLSPDKTVLIPDPDAGCSLSESITADQLRALEGRASRRGGGHVRQHLGRGEGRDGLLLHVGERRPGGRAHLARARAGHGDPLRPRHVAGLVRRPRDRADRRPGALRAVPRLGRRVPCSRRHPARRHRRACAPSTPAPSS